MNLEDKVIECLEPLQKALDEGERIVVWVTTRCGCADELTFYDVKKTKCHICNGKGFVFSARTFLPC